MSQMVAQSAEPGQVTATTVTISWKTNHYSKNNKINYGETMSYGQHAFAPDYRREHIIQLTNLQPGTKYVFEVMSQSKNYVYDAHHEFTTRAE